MGVAATVASVRRRRDAGRGVERAVVLGLHLLARRWGWWNFDAQGGLFLGMPVDLFAAWVSLWSIVPALAFPASHPFVPRPSRSPSISF
jgi:hypothetical protein